MFKISIVTEQMFRIYSDVTTTAVPFIYIQIYICITYFPPEPHSSKKSYLI